MCLQNHPPVIWDYMQLMYSVCPLPSALSMCPDSADVCIATKYELLMQPQTKGDCSEVTELCEAQLTSNCSAVYLKFDWPQYLNT